MSWAAVGIGLGTAAVGYFGQRQNNRQAARASENQGYVDTVTTRNPYPGTQGYREAAQQAAYEALFGPGEHPAGRPANIAQVQGDPNADTATALATARNAPAGTRVNARGQTVPVRNGGGGAGGGRQPAFNGQSQETRDILARMNELPGQNAGMLNAGESYVTDTLQGEERNPLRGEATQAARDIAEDPRLSGYEDFLQAELGIGGQGTRTAGGTGASAPGAGDAPVLIMPGGGGGMGIGGVQGAGGGQIAGTTGTDVALRKLVAGEKPAGWDEAEAGITRKVNEGRAANIRELRARAVGSGFYGGDVYKDLEEGAIARGDQEMADSLAAARFGAYQNALGLGTQYDLGMADIGARDRATNAGAGASAASLASQEKLAKMGLFQDALQLGEQSRFGRAGALGDLAALTSSDQRSALQGVNDLAGSRRADVGAAGELSLGSDQARNQFIASQNQLRAAQIAGGNQRADLAFERERFYDPFARIGAYTDITNSLYGGYGSEETHGRDTRSTPPPAYSSPLGAALQAGAIGAQAGAAYQPRKRATAPAGTGGG